MSEPRIALSRVHHPVTVLGPGRRAGVWFQGCRIRCPGCISADTWDAGNDARVPVADVLAWLAGLAPDQVEGVTISGGEPTDQPEALAALLDGVLAWRAARDPELPVPDVLVFTGRAPGWLAGRDAGCLDGADAVMAGPYVAAQAGRSPLRGSDNQRLVLRTALGRSLGEAYDRCRRTSLQIEVRDGALWMLGIPLPDTMAAVERAVTPHGIELHERSWLT